MGACCERERDEGGSEFYTNNRYRAPARPDPGTKMKQAPGYNPISKELKHQERARRGAPPQFSSEANTGRTEGLTIKKDEDGRGTFKWSDGSTYYGEFIDTNIHGYGTYTWNDGRVFEGDWRMNKMEGHGKFTWPDGRKYEGDYNDDKKEGQGQFTWLDGRKYVGGWRNGVQHGKGTFTSAKGKIRNGVWNDGQLTGWVK